MVMQINAGDTFEDRGHLYTIDRIYERNSESGLTLTTSTAVGVSTGQ